MGNRRKVYSHRVGPQDLLRVYKIQLYDNSVWINAGDGTFISQTANHRFTQLPIDQLYPSVWRGFDIHDNLIVGRKWPSPGHYYHLKKVVWVSKRTGRPVK